jgi:hypothetical protein
VPVALPRREVGQLAQRPLGEPEGNVAGFRILLRPEALEEVLVGVRGVELDQLDLLRTAAEKLGELERQVRLAGTGCYPRCLSQPLLPQ